MLKLRPIVPSNYQTKHIGHLILFNGGDKGPLKLLPTCAIAHTAERITSTGAISLPPFLPLSSQAFQLPCFAASTYYLARKGAAVFCSSNKCTLCGPGR